MDKQKIFKFDVGADIYVLDIGLGKILSRRLDECSIPLYTIKFRTGKTPDGMFLAREEELKAIEYLYNEEKIARVILDNLPLADMKLLIALPDPEIAFQAVVQEFAKRYPNEWARITERAREVA